jgi:hypothetical protein
MILDAFVGKQVDTLMVVIKERQGSEGTIRLKCPNPLLTSFRYQRRGI